MLASMIGGELPPPNPADWICDGDLSCLVAEPYAGPWRAPQPWERLTTWGELISYRDAYRARHGAPERY